MLRVTVDVSGTGGGFKKFCAGETDITGASRPIHTAEMDLPQKNSIEYTELPIAFDAVSVIVNPYQRALYKRQRAASTRR